MSSRKRIFANEMQDIYAKNGTEAATDFYVVDGGMLDRHLAKLKFLASHGRPVVILGGVSSGKTTMLQWLLWQTSPEAVGVIYQDEDEISPMNSHKNVTVYTKHGLKENSMSLQDVIDKASATPEAESAIKRHYDDLVGKGTSDVPVPFLTVGEITSPDGEEMGILKQVYDKGWQYFATVSVGPKGTDEILKKLDEYDTDPIFVNMQGWHIQSLKY